MNNNDTHIIATVNVAESVRRNKPTATKTVTIPLADLVALADETTRRELADYVGKRSSGNLTDPATGYDLRAIPTPDAAGVLEAFAAALQQRQKQQALIAEATAEVERKILESNGSAGLADNGWWRELFYEMGTTVPLHTLRSEVRALIETASKRRVAELAVEKEKSDAVCREATSKAHAEQLARLLPHLDAEEREMHARNYLKLAEVEERLTDEALDALRTKIEPPGYEMRTCTGMTAVKPTTKEHYRELRRVEKLTGLTGELVAVAYLSCDVQVTLTTADGRTFPVQLRRASEN